LKSITIKSECILLWIIKVRKTTKMREKRLNYVS